MLRCLENLAKRKATVLGKPGQPLVELMRKEPQFKNPKRVLYIGDSLVEVTNSLRKEKLKHVIPAWTRI
jgi:ribonucleotide monophosphatase NagD (HAD superfamily)